jgi:hypothetical protein
MKSPVCLAPVLIAVLAVAAMSQPAAAFTKPQLDLAVGKTFGIDGTPSTGGMSVAFSPLWNLGERSRFGVTGFVDDIGTSAVQLVDRTNSLDLGTVADLHRLTYGVAWRADHDVVRRKRWAAAVTGLAGWWRVADDVRGNPTTAASAIGFGLGLEARKAMTLRHEFGLAVRYQELTSDRHAAFRRVDHYATAALSWRWTVDAGK